MAGGSCSIETEKRRRPFAVFASIAAWIAIGPNPSITISVWRNKAKKRSLDIYRNQGCNSNGD